MKKQMKLWQLTLGYVICVGIIFSMFLSRITISSDRIIDCVTDIMDDISEKYNKQKGEKDSDWSDFLGKTFDKDEKNNLKKNVEKNFGDKKITCSSAQIMFASKHWVEKYVLDITGAEKLGKGEKLIIGKFYEALFWPRVLLFAIYFLPIVLIILYYLTYWKKWRNFFAIISTWLYVILAAISNILWYFFLPVKGAETLTSFTGGGIWVFMIGSLLLFIYSLLLLLLRDKSYAGQDIPILEDIIQQRNSNTIDYVNEENNPMKRSVEKARIYITKGSLAGGEISCLPGEQIVVGRDPDVADLVLSHPKISRKHFVLQYVEDKDCYQIFCFSKNGIYLSTGEKIGMSQSANIARGTMLALADGEEGMVLA